MSYKVQAFKLTDNMNAHEKVNTLVLHSDFSLTIDCLKESEIETQRGRGRGREKIATEII